MSEKDKSLDLYKLTRADQMLTEKDQKIAHEKERKAKIIIQYVESRGSVKADCVQLTWDLYDTLHMGVMEITLFIRSLEDQGKMKYSKGYYVIGETNNA